MIQFWLGAALLCVMAMVIVVWPRRRAADVDREAVNVALYRGRRAELAREHAEGRLTDQELTSLEEELSAGLLLDAEQTGPQGGAPGRPLDRRVVFTVAVVAPLLAFAGYSQLGSIDDVALASDVRNMATPHGAGAAPHSADELRGLIEKLEKRLVGKPEDADGWFLLGRTAISMQDYARAAHAFGRVAALAPSAPAPLVFQAQAEFMQADKQITPGVRTTIDKALALAPGEPALMELLAVDAFDRRDYRATLGYLNQGLAHEMPPEQRSYFEQGVAKARQLLGEPALPPGSSAAPGMASAAPTAAVPGHAVDVEVNVAPGVKIAPEATIFVVAKAVGGPPMPLAVQRRATADLPFRVRLDPSTAMNPAFSMASVEDVVVSARASRLGTPQHAPDDVEIISPVLHLGANAISVQLTLGGVAQPPSVVANAATAVRSSSDTPSSTPGGTVVRVLVELGDQVEAPPTTPVFVFAREAGGSRIPVAVRRLTVADLPTLVLLDDTSAMQPERTLSSVGRIEVVARVARGGSVMPTKGDVEGQSSVFAPKQARQVVRIVINKVRL